MYKYLLKVNKINKNIYSLKIYVHLNNDKRQE